MLPNITTFLFLVINDPLKHRVKCFINVLTCMYKELYVGFWHMPGNYPHDLDQI